LEDFRLILACVRNPYELEFSYYCHLRKESVRKRRKRAVAELSLARAGDFETFAREAPFFGRLPSGIERYYLLRGAKPDNMHIIRLEEIGFDIPALAPYTLSRFPIPHINRKDDAGRWRARLAPALALVEKSLPRIEGGWRDHLTPATECAIYEKYRYLFSFYPRVGSPADG
jgi:hypothetical protein